MLVGQAQQDQRQAYFVVEVALRLEGIEAARQHGGDDLFGGGLAHAARDAYHLHVVARPPPGRQPLQRGQWVVYSDERVRRHPPVRPWPIRTHHCAECPISNRINYIIVPVNPLTLKGNKKGAAGSLARVYYHVLESGNM